MEKSLGDILRETKASLPPAQPPQPSQELLLPVWEFTSDLVNTFMFNGKPLSLPYKTQNPFIASMLNREYVAHGILRMEKLPAEPPRYISVRKESL